MLSRSKDIYRPAFTAGRPGTFGKVTENGLGPEDLRLTCYEKTQVPIGLYNLTGSQTIICDAAQVLDQPGRFLDPRAAQSFVLNHVTAVSRTATAFSNSLRIICGTENFGQCQRAWKEQKRQVLSLSLPAVSPRLCSAASQQWYACPDDQRPTRQRTGQQSLSTHCMCHGTWLQHS